MISSQRGCYAEIRTVGSGVEWVVCLVGGVVSAFDGVFGGCDSGAGLK